MLEKRRNARAASLLAAHAMTAFPGRALAHGELLTDGIGCRTLRYRRHHGPLPHNKSFKPTPQSLRDWGSLRAIALRRGLTPALGV